jgi:hypothetical protein
MNYSMTGRTNNQEILEIRLRCGQPKREGQLVMGLKAVLAYTHLVTTGEVEGT